MKYISTEIAEGGKRMVLHLESGIPQRKHARTVVGISAAAAA